MNAPRKLLFTALLLLVTSPALAQSTDATPTVGEVARMRTEVSNEIYSPFCPGKTLAMCTSPNAAAVRRDIQDLARDGKDKETIKNEIVARYGEEFRFTEPPAQDNAALGKRHARHGAHEQGSGLKGAG
jgi:cytochrome c-type biogenesis protein CcmH/NrfF